MTTLKQLSKIKNLLIDAKQMSVGIEDLNLTSKLDMAMYNFIEAYDAEENRLRSQGKNGNDILSMIRD
jgi:hypothetical protein